MKFQKMLFSLALIFSFSFSQLSAGTAPSSLDLTEQIGQYLENINFADNEDITEVKIDFMIVEGGEILVLSTDIKEIESIIKTRLNYKKVETGIFEQYKKYTLPVVFERK